MVNTFFFRINFISISSNYNLKCSLLDPSRLSEFDNFLQSYSELLFKWELYNKRIEILELLHEKPKDLDEKFGKLTLYLHSNTTISTVFFLI